MKKKPTWKRMKCVFFLQTSNLHRNNKKYKNKKTFSLALDHWELCELSINIKSSGFYGIYKLIYV
jgi:hypothetical protein